MQVLKLELGSPKILLELSAFYTPILMSYWGRDTVYLSINQSHNITATAETRTHKINAQLNTYWLCFH